MHTHSRGVKPDCLSGGQIHLMVYTVKVVEDRGWGRDNELETKLKEGVVNRLRATESSWMLIANLASEKFHAKTFR